jgi:PhnB protein
MALKLTPYIVLDGRANEAMHFYENVLGAKIVFNQSFGESPEKPEFPLPPEAKDRVMHAVIQIGESELFFSDTPPGQPSQPGDQVTLCIQTDDREKSKRIFEALSEGGKVQMPLQETFFSPAYGIVTDKFGTTFQIFTEGAH